MKGRWAVVAEQTVQNSEKGGTLHWDNALIGALHGPLAVPLRAHLDTEETGLG